MLELWKLKLKIYISRISQSQNQLIKGDFLKIRVLNLTLRSACVFEHMLSHSQGMCGCTPWNMPFDDTSNVPMCDYQGAFCFEQVTVKH